MNSETNTQLNRFGMVSCSHCIGCSEMEEEYYQCSTEEDIAAEEGKKAEEDIEADKAGAGEGTAGVEEGIAEAVEDKMAEEGIEAPWTEEGKAAAAAGTAAGTEEDTTAAEDTEEGKTAAAGTAARASHMRRCLPPS